MSENAKEKETPLWLAAIWTALTFVAVIVLLFGFFTVVFAVTDPIKCARLQTANTAPGYEYRYDFFTGCRVHIPSGLWVPQTDLDKYLTAAPPTLTTFPKEFVK